MDWPGRNKFTVNPLFLFLFSLSYPAYCSLFGPGTLLFSTLYTLFASVNKKCTSQSHTKAQVTKLTEKVKEMIFICHFDSQGRRSVPVPLSKNNASYRCHLCISLKLSKEKKLSFMEVASCYWNKMICFKSQFSSSVPFFHENHSYM